MPSTPTTPVSRGPARSRTVTKSRTKGRDAAAVDDASFSYRQDAYDLDAQ